MIQLIADCQAKTNLAQLAYENIKLIERPIYIKEYTSPSEYSYVPYTVVTDDYNGKVLLLRKDVTVGKGIPINKGFSFATSQFRENASSYYKGSYMDEYLNEEYIFRFSDYVNKHIVETNIEITNDEDEKELEAMKTKIFLLSLNEYNLGKDASCLKEGNKLSYFKKKSARSILVSDEKSEYMGYWTRTRDIYDDEIAYVVSDRGGSGWQDCGDYATIRPAFCMDGNTKIELSEEAVSGKKVYVLKGDNHCVEDYNTKNNLSQLSYENSKLYENEIYIKEYTDSLKYSYIPYIAVTDDYDGKVLLLRRDATIGEGIPINEGEVSTTTQLSDNASAYYKDSYMDKFLNAEYISRFSEYVKKNIAQTNIQITNDNTNKDIEIMNTKVFLLSLTEYNIVKKENCLEEGKKLSYFKMNGEGTKLEDENIEYKGYWTRTRDIYDERTYIISDKGTCKSRKPTDKACVRPAFCMDGNTKIKLSEDVISGEKVYVLEGDD